MQCNLVTKDYHAFKESRNGKSQHNVNIDVKAALINCPQGGIPEDFLLTPIGTYREEGKLLDPFSITNDFGALAAEIEAE